MPSRRTQPPDPAAGPGTSAGPARSSGVDWGGETMKDEFEDAPAEPRTAEPRIAGAPSAGTPADPGRRGFLGASAVGLAGGILGLGVPLQMTATRALAQGGGLEGKEGLDVLN